MGPQKPIHIVFFTTFSFGKETSSKDYRATFCYEVPQSFRMEH